MKEIIIMECPTSLGLAQSEYAREPGVNKLPDWLRQWGFHKAVSPSKTLRLEAPKYAMELDVVTQVRNADAIIKYATEQMDMMEQEINENTFIVLLGGDCSVLIGTALALRRKGRFGMFYLDGHTDYMIPAESNTHGAAGMDLSIVCGHGHQNLTNIMDLAPYVEQDHVYAVGNREYDEDYERPIKESQVNYYPLDRLRDVGVDSVVTHFLFMVEVENLDGYIVHLDVDVLNDEVMPAVDCPQADGLSYEELKSVLLPLLINKKCYGIEITILDPDLDPTGAYTQEFIGHIVSVIKTVKCL
ncbi:arginase family protein [Myroides sp. M-43]|uniref:arginase family protein n=1 Tax=Myroides oncorhynchi TaxID=2893756 RepID=UPI001E32263D|nr:arginase family protein [Myroides oncorhynchi]MCC9043355.1 arginase family protein [Myroides oncorhynchi]